MESAYTVPLMSTVDSSQHMRSYGSAPSHQRSYQRLSRPHVLPRIPSERLDPRSIHDNHNSTDHGSSKKCGEHSRSTYGPLKTNEPLSAPSLSTNGSLLALSDPREATTQQTESSSSSHSQGHSRSLADSKSQIGARKMDSKSRYRYHRTALFPC